MIKNDGKYINSREIAEIIKKDVSTVKTYMARPEFAPYRRIIGENMFVLNCKEVRAYFRKMIKTFSLVSDEESLELQKKLHEYKQQTKYSNYMLGYLTKLSEPTVRNVLRGKKVSKNTYKVISQYLKGAEV